MHIPSITTEPYSRKCDFFYSQRLFLFHQALMFRAGHGEPFISYHMNRCRNKKKKLNLAVVDTAWASSRLLSSLGDCNLLTKNLKQCSDPSGTFKTQIKRHRLYHKMSQELCPKSTRAGWKWEFHFRMVIGLTFTFHISSDKSLSKTCRCCLSVFGNTHSPKQAVLDVIRHSSSLIK